MTRGNARDLARAKTAKKNATLNKGNQEDIPAHIRKERDAEIMRLKQLAAQQRQQEGGAAPAAAAAAPAAAPAKKK